jgi:hypothetical protein
MAFTNPLGFNRIHYRNARRIKAPAIPQALG